MKKTTSLVKENFCTYESHKGMTPREFLARLNVIAPNSATLAERSPVRIDIHCKRENSHDNSCVNEIPDSIEDIARTFESPLDFCEHMIKLKYTDAEVNCLEQNTLEQTQECWLRQRKGRITASKFYRVYSRMKTLSKSPNTDMQKCVCEVLQYSTPPKYLPALEHGRETEPVACKSFEDFYNSIGHENVKVEKCGLYVMKSAPFLGASPDRICECSCCGKFVLEVKCPVAKNIEPNEVDCLEMVNGKLRLKHSHPYYAQVQGQLAVTGLLFAYFFVYLGHDFFVEKINFNADFWTSLCDSLCDFFFKFLSKELVLRNYLNVKNEIISDVLAKPPPS